MTTNVIDEPVSKRCSRCGEVKPLDDFHRHRSRRDGRQPFCKACIAARYRQRKAEADAEGLCRDCSAPAAEGHVYCAEHLAALRARVAAHRAFWRARQTGRPS